MSKKTLSLILVFSLCVFCCMLATSCDNQINAKPLSKTIIGDWHGEFDIAKIVYKELGDELGIDLAPEPVFCPAILSFIDGEQAMLEVKNEDFAKAVGKCAEPYITGIFGFNTEGLIDLLMQKIATDMESDGINELIYEVNDDDNSILITDKYGDAVIVKYNDGKLEYESEEFNQVIVFEKE